jgi:hypothetical protein
MYVTIIMTIAYLRRQVQSTCMHLIIMPVALQEIRESSIRRVSRASQLFISRSQPINLLANLQLLFTARIMRTRHQLVRLLVLTLTLKTLH